jgi:hypothetical protein
MSSTATIHCLSVNNDNLTLNYEIATGYSVLISFFVSCLSISLSLSGVLRLISVIKKSEEAGLQLLGPDNIALNKIRLVSVTFSSIFPCLMISLFNAHPGMFSLFYETESTSFAQDIDKNFFIALYLVSPCSAIVVNTLAKIFSNFAKRNIDQQVNVFTIYESNPCISEGKVTFSLEATVGIALLMLFGFLPSYLDRVERLTFFLSNSNLAPRSYNSKFCNQKKHKNNELYTTELHQQHY